MRANSDKSHLLISCPETLKLMINDSCTESSKKELLLGIRFDNELKFDDHVNYLCKKTGQKLHALSRIAPFMNKRKRRIIMKAFIESQFEYCPLIWMFHSRALNNKINRIHERALRITYSDKISTFQELLDKDNSVSIHQRNVRVLALEIYKVLYNHSPPILNDIFIPSQHNYDLRRNDTLERRRVNSVRFGTESISFLGPKIWDMIPKDIKESETVQIFKAKIKKWIPRDCPCRLCKTYIAQIGFI